MKGETTTQTKIRFNDCDPIGHLNNVKYLDYMLNAREDHVVETYGFTYEEHIRLTGCTWVAIQNQIAYLKEVRPNTLVNISSKIIKLGERTSVVEILMRDEKNEAIHAVLWTTAIYFSMKERRSVAHSPELMEFFKDFWVEIPEQHFEQRTESLRKENKQWRKS
ncbi:thioesterase [Elizabethkingia miricola]|uniref:Acyl-CoA thioesterase n=1 Tax=Elizabethkingia miricola TaxID=172045 RepID=A0ABD5B6Q4_ELIMR|nr:acyl-CoA thioesterase [Elizabethkingia miricola]MDQ8749516.1 acyl-CoA thioesterase [Elizabethkingia miricola]OPB92259.1 thioesterase [Elizabethkingia miricola]